VPAAQITRHPKHRSQNRRPLFAFTANLARSTFRCSIDKKPYRPCTSPLRLHRLAFGKHRFRVFAVSPSGEKGKPAVFRFKVLKKARPN
jgi:hypothetical protein